MYLFLHILCVVYMLVVYMLAAFKGWVGEILNA